MTCRLPHEVIIRGIKKVILTHHDPQVINEHLETSVLTEDKEATDADMAFRPTRDLAVPNVKVGFSSCILWVVLPTY